MVKLMVEVSPMIVNGGLKTTIFVVFCVTTFAMETMANVVSAPSIFLSESYKGTGKSVSAKLV